MYTALMKISLIFQLDSSSDPTKLKKLIECLEPVFWVMINYILKIMYRGCFSNVYLSSFGEPCAHLGHDTKNNDNAMPVNAD